MSRPNRSVPNGCDAVGAPNRSVDGVNGLVGASHGPANARNRTTITSTTPDFDVRSLRLYRSNVRRTAFMLEALARRLDVFELDVLFGLPHEARQPLARGPVPVQLIEW